MHEILTLQFGHRANYLATHFWNTQESYFTYDDSQGLSPVNPNIHFRAGCGPKGEDTFTPRTLIYDLKGGFGSMRKGAGLYEDDGKDEGARGNMKNVWNGKVVVQEEAIIPQSEYQRNLDLGVDQPSKPTVETVRFWSDFSRLFYHPKSAIQINDFEMGSLMMPFERWTSGEELFAAIDREVDVLDRDLRFWAEECDHIQGVQVLTGGDDAWGGFAARYVERIRDEFGKTAMWVWGIEEGHETEPRAKYMQRAVNVARSIHDVSAHATTYVPLAIPSLGLSPSIHFNRSSWWHTSALLSVAVESMTLPSRLRHLSHTRGNLDTMSATLNTNGNQRIAHLSCRFHDGGTTSIMTRTGPQANDDRVSGSTTARGNGGDDDVGRASDDIDMNLSCGEVQGTNGLGGRRRKEDHVFGRIGHFRGFTEQHGTDHEEEDELWRNQKRLGLPVVEQYYTPLPFPLLDSFPNILVPRFLRGSDSVAVHTSLSTTSIISQDMRRLRRIVDRTASPEEREALSNGLGNIAEAYDDGWDSGSDNGSDD